MTDAHPEQPIALIADDDAAVRLMLAEAVEQAGLASIVVADGAQALETGLRTRFTVALLDVEMPGLDGYAVCRGLRQTRHGSTAQILMITGLDDARSVERAFEAGATDFIAKPLNWPLMPHRLRYVLRNAAALDELRFREAENRTLLQAIPDRIHVLSPDGRVLRALGHLDAAAGADEPDGPRDIDALVPAELVTRARQALREAAAGSEPRPQDFEQCGSDGAPRYYQMRYFRARDGEIIAMRQDVTLHRRQEERIRQLAYFDQLTGLPNRQCFTERVGALAPSASEPGSELAIVHLDLNGFRRVNETFGHKIGDEILQVVAERVQRCLSGAAADGAATECARFGGDEFVMSLYCAGARERAIELAKACGAVLSLPVEIRDQDVFMEPSIGIAVSPQDGSDVETLLKNADTAMHQVKSRQAAGFLVYARTMSSRAEEWLALDSHLRHAVRDEMFEIYYQPKVQLAGGALVGVEALLRWFHPELGAISPGRFIPLAEESGLILDLGGWLIKAVCRQLRHWQDRGLNARIAFNLSGKELLHGDPVRLLREATEASGVDPSCLEAEITESVLITDLARGRSALADLRALGCRIALDDFGTGYSSLAYLRRFPPDTLKVDRVFISNVHRDRGDAAIVEAILALAASLGVTVVAEGIEEQAQVDWLCARGCALGQGFLLGKPMPAHRLEALYLNEADSLRHQALVSGGGSAS